MSFSTCIRNNGTASLRVYMNVCGSVWVCVGVCECAWVCVCAWVCMAVYGGCLGVRLHVCWWTHIIGATQMLVELLFLVRPSTTIPAT